MVIPTDLEGDEELTLARWTKGAKRNVVVKAGKMLYCPGWCRQPPRICHGASGPDGHSGPDHVGFRVRYSAADGRENIQCDTFGQDFPATDAWATGSGGVDQTPQLDVES